MLYFLPESEHHIVLLLLDTLYSVYIFCIDITNLCSGLLSRLSLLPSLFQLFFFLCPCNFPAFFFPYTRFTPACWLVGWLVCFLACCSAAFLPPALDVPIHCCGEIQWISPDVVLLVTTKFIFHSSTSQTGNSRFCFQVFLVVGEILALKSQDHQEVLRMVRFGTSLC